MEAKMGDLNNTVDVANQCEICFQSTQVYLFIYLLSREEDGWEVEGSDNPFWAIIWNNKSVLT